MNRKPYPTEVSDEAWKFVVPYLNLLPEEAGQRRHDLREVFNALRWIVRTSAFWRWLPHDFPPWQIVYLKPQRLIAAGVFEFIVYDCQLLKRAASLDKVDDLLSKGC
ncbi:MAG: transposase [Desulfocurvibacter africanus]